MEGFCQKLREKVSYSLFDRFLQYLNCYGDGRINTPCLNNKVAELFKSYPEFVREFLHLFYVDSEGSSIETIDEDDNNKEAIGNNKVTIESMLANCTLSNPESDEILDEIKKKKKVSDPESDEILDEIKKKVSDFCGRVRKEFNLEEFKELLLCLLDYGDGKISKVDMKIKVNDMFPDIITNQFIEALNLIDTDTSTDQASSSSSSSSDTIIINDWLDDIELTPSYNLLSKKVSDQISRSNDPGDSEVLNFCLYSKPVACCEGNKENKYENKDNLSSFEDELFEKDMAVSRFHSTGRKLKELYRVIREGEIKNPNIADVVNSYLTATNCRTIEFIWGDHGLDMVENLRHWPEVVLPILCRRFDQIMEGNGSCSCKDTASDLTNLQHDCFPSHGEEE
ncbi:Paired amphipathic helix [Corchorus capsularis]|uniref:Paired amphipathic helix n=1 Tax=Corchorus capsularis TaxID=210143 RepID=A0A1R3II44_COCAP|nr:Paired amphipathic helix [Corchorus capsularis]